MNNKYSNSAKNLTTNSNSQTTSVSNNIFEFKRSIKVSCCIVQANISVDVELKYILPILIHIKDKDGKATFQSISQKLDRGSIFHKKLIQKLLDTASDNALIYVKNECYFITKNGHHIINDKSFSVQKNKNNIMLQITYSLDPLINDDNKLLEIRDGTRNAKRIKNIKYRIKPIDSDLDTFLKNRSCVTSKTDDYTANRIFKQKTRFTILEYFKSMKPLTPDIAVDLVWSLDSNTSELFLTQKSIKDKKLISRIKYQMPNINHKKIWNAISFSSDNGSISKSDNEWDRKLNRILVSYDDITPKECASMQAVLSFRLNLDESCFNNYSDYSTFRQFEELEKTVDIYPKDSKEAQKWASDMRKYLLSNYLTRVDYGNHLEKIKGKFLNYTIHFDDDIDYDKTDPYGYDERHKSYWYLHVMEDWNL